MRMSPVVCKSTRGEKRNDWQTRAIDSKLLNALPLDSGAGSK